MDQTTCQRAFAGFHGEPACNITVFSDHTRDDFTLTSRENMESIICLLTEWTLEASKLFQADSIMMFLIEKGAFAVV